MASCLRQLCIMMGKHLLVMRRRPVFTAFEFLTPILLFALVKYLLTYSIELKKENKSPAISDMFIVGTFPQKMVRLYYIPKGNSFVDALMANVAKVLDLKDNQKLVPLATEAELVEIIRNNTARESERDPLEQNVNGSAPASNISTHIAVVFDVQDATKPKKLQFTIRTRDRKWVTSARDSEDDMKADEPGLVHYINTGFLAVQYAIEIVFRNTMQGSTQMARQVPPVGFSVQAFPEATTGIDFDTTALAVLLMFSLVILVPLIVNVLMVIMADKQNGASELLKMMGLSRSMFWFTWFLRVMITGVVVAPIMGVLLKPMLPGNDLLVVILIFLLYFAATATYIFFVSSLFSKPIVALLFGVLVWFFSNVICQMLDRKFNPPLAFKLISSLIPNVAIFNGLIMIGKIEMRGTETLWENVQSSANTSGDFTLCHLVIMLMVDIILFYALTLYLDTICPGVYGLPQPWNFCFTRSYWGWRDQARPETTETTETTSLLSLSHYEPVRQPLKVGIEVRDLRKVYASGKKAVNGVTLDIYEDQITVLLGHNGAGKTTAMSIITGMIPSTSGDVWISGYNIRTDMPKVRKSLGLCPQHNMNIASLTVKEHIVFFGRLKGCTRSEAKAEAVTLMEAVDLQAKANQPVSKLSGGMKRRLQLAIALVGDSHVVVLDEPTSGLDPEARRKVWDMLLRERGRRTILLTTHFMEEADALGDRVAIMDHGRVQCYGTSQYLKKKYGSGYVLKLLTTKTADPKAITSFVQAAIPGALPKSSIGAQMSFVIPLEQKASYASLFESIESKKQQLGVISIGVALTSLEDVFITVGAQSHSSSQADEESAAIEHSECMNRLLEKDDSQKAKGFHLKMHQSYGLLVKKIIFTWRSFSSFLFATLIVVLLTLFNVIGTFSAVEMLRDESQPPVSLTLSAHGHTEVIHSGPASAPNVGQRYAALVTQQGSTSRPVTPGCVTGELQSEVNKDFSLFFRDIIVGGEMSEGPTGINVIAMYSPRSHHAVPITINLMNNALLQAAMNSDEYSLTVVNYPFDVRSLPDNSVATYMTVQGFWTSNISLSFVCFSAVFLIFPLTERINGGKHLQLMTGVGTFFYWTICFLVDLAFFAVAILLVELITFVGDPNRMFGNESEYGMLTLILVLFGLANIPYTYLFTFVGKTPVGGFAIYLGVNLILVFFMPGLLLVIGVLAPDSKSLLRRIKRGACILPPYCLHTIIEGWVMDTLVNNRCPSMGTQAVNTMCAENPSDQCCKSQTPRTYLEFDTPSHETAIGWQAMMLVIEVFLYSALVLACDLGMISLLTEAVKRLLIKRAEQELDDDVEAEADRVTEYDGDVLVVRDLSRAYNCRRLTVKGLSFGVASGECFGLLGVNGAGKTTTFSVLTGYTRATRGEASVMGYSLSRHKKQYLFRVGYCPQFDAFNELLTAREMLRCFARLRGLRRREAKEHVNMWLLVMGLTEFQDALSGTYSGGNKRKLSTAIALIGSPPLVFLDEPTSGVDPVARRNLWAVLAAVQKTDTAIVLTSHSMDENEALCSRLAIMVSGQLHCIGPSLYLKQKFSQGFTAQIKLKEAHLDPQGVATFKDAFKAAFLKSTLKDEHSGWLHYHLTDPNARWGNMFSSMEALKSKHQMVEDYTLSETTLEQIFLNFATT